MRHPKGNIGSLLMGDKALPRRSDGRPHQVMFHFDDESRVTALALSADGDPLVWGVDMNDSDDPTTWTADVAPPEIAAAAWAWFEGQQHPPSG